MLTWHDGLLAEVPSSVTLGIWLVLSEWLGGRVRWGQLRGAMGEGVQVHGWG